MENKINIAELLKDCPMGMELDCISYNGTVCFEELNSSIFPIKISIHHDGEIYHHTLTKYGKTSETPYNKCVIFPKGKTTWEGFVPPCSEFKDGDIISNGNFIAIFYKIGTPAYCTSPNIVYYHCYYSQKLCKFKGKLDFGIGFSTNFKYATEEEKEKLFQAIKDNGYKWNAETKILDKLIVPKFKVGDKIKYKNGENKDGIKMGIILSITNDQSVVDNTTYDVAVSANMGVFIPITEQDEWELVPNKFDISNLKPYKSEILYRNSLGGYWKPAFWGAYIPENSNHNFLTTYGFTRYCIPFEGNEHLMGKQDDCNEYYKIWEG